MSHSFQATIDLVRSIIAQTPPRFSVELAHALRERMEVLAADAGVTRAALDAFAIDVGKARWPYRRAWEECYAREGATMEREQFLAQLPHVLREHVESDVDRTSFQAPQDILRLPAFEQYTPEDRLILEEALLAARHTTAAALARRVDTGDLPAYERDILQWEQQRIAIDAELLTLREFAREHPALAEEIAATIRAFELGFTGVLGTEPTLAAVRGSIADFRARA